MGGLVRGIERGGGRLKGVEDGAGMRGEGRAGEWDGRVWEERRGEREKVRKQKRGCWLSRGKEQRTSLGVGGLVGLWRGGEVSAVMAEESSPHPPAE